MEGRGFMYSAFPMFSGNQTITPRAVKGGGEAEEGVTMK